MLATFVIGLREGLEAALIVGIIAAFLRQSGRADALKKMWLGVAGAVLICLALGFGLQALNASLPQRQQEMLESTVAAIAVAMVTYMVLWMRRNSRDLRSQLQASAGGALAAGSATALVLMAFLAVFREGFETAVFLLAAFQNTGSSTRAALGAILGIAVALVVGYLIYRGGVKLNLSRFFRFTGVVLVLVAAGLVMSALRAAHEAGWLLVGQEPAFRMDWLVRPGTVQESLLTGMLGVRASMPVIEVVAWLLYLVPMVAVVLWPPRRVPSARRRFQLLAGAGGVAVVVAVALVVFAPSATSSTHLGAGGLVGSITSGVDPATGADATGGAVQGQVQATVSGDRSIAVLDFTIDGAGYQGAVPVQLFGHAAVGEVDAAEYRAAAIVVTPTGLPVSLTPTLVAAINGGRLPVGAGGMRGSFGADYTDSVVPTLIIDPVSGTVLNVALALTRSLTLTPPGGGGVISAGHIRVETAQLTESATAERIEAAGAAASAARRHQLIGQVLPGLLSVWGVVLVAFAMAGRRRGRRQAPLVRSGPSLPVELPPAGEPMSAVVDRRTDIAMNRPDPPLVGVSTQPRD